MFDCIVIGGGVVGTAVFDRLCRYQLKVLLLEKSDDVASFASRANSGIIHAGFDCTPGTLKAKFNVLGNKQMWADVKELNVPHLKCGSLVVATEEEFENIKNLKEKGDANGVITKILNREETVAIEPNVSDSIKYSLFAPEAGIVSPYQLTIAYADRGILNGGEIKLNHEVVSIQKENDYFTVKTNNKEYDSKVVINCAGPFGTNVNEMIDAEKYTPGFRRGDYFVLDNVERKNVNTVIFPTPTKLGKGILVAPTADGNVIYGPSAIDEDVPSTASSLDSFEMIKSNVSKTYKNPAFNKCIRVYSGTRTYIDKDFIIGESKLVKGFFMAIGICSPGLTSAPAIGEYLSSLIVDKLNAKKKDSIVLQMKKALRLNEMTPDEINTLIKIDPKWGRIVCRCEKITEAEIVNAIHSPLKAVTVDAIKRRTRTGMGRCQGGFCGPRVMEIIARELNIPITQVKKGNGDDSNIARFKIKEVK